MNFIDKYIRAGKRVALFQYVGYYLAELVPSWWFNMRRRRWLRHWESRPDAGYLRMRRDHYCQLQEITPLNPDKSVKVRDVRIGNFQSRYAMDARKVLRYFPKDALVSLIDGDIRVNPRYPALIKARRLDDEYRENAVILNLDSYRHWLRPKDSIPFDKKIPKLLFRGDIYGKPARMEFFRRWASHPLMDLGDTNRSHPSEWHTDFISVPDHFHYQFILALEGYDVASALQWIMASNCVPVMTRPAVESWLMHGRLIPGVHYIEIASDFSDVGEKMEYYVAHPEEAEKISVESKKWARQFFNRRRERLVALLVVDKYLRMTRPGQ